MDQYPSVTVKWQLHRKPELHARNAAGRNVTVDLSPLGYAELHQMFGSHFPRSNVAPPSWRVRAWRRLFGWGYGMSTFEAALLFIGAGVLLLAVGYVLCFRYTALCDSIQDL